MRRGLISSDDRFMSKSFGGDPSTPLNLHRHISTDVTRRTFSGYLLKRSNKPYNSYQDNDIDTTHTGTGTGPEILPFPQHPHSIQIDTSNAPQFPIMTGTNNNNNYNNNNNTSFAPQNLQHRWNVTELELNNPSEGGMNPSPFVIPPPSQQHQHQPLNASFHHPQHQFQQQFQQPSETNATQHPNQPAESENQEEQSEKKNPLQAGLESVAAFFGFGAEHQHHHHHHDDSVGNVDNRNHTNTENSATRPPLHIPNNAALGIDTTHHVSHLPPRKKSAPIKVVKKPQNILSSEVSSASVATSHASYHRRHTLPDSGAPDGTSGLGPAPEDYIDPKDGHVWRSKYCVLEDGVLYFYRDTTDGESPEAAAERQNDYIGAGGGTGAAHNSDQIDYKYDTFDNHQRSNAANVKDLSKSPMARRFKLPANPNVAGHGHGENFYDDHDGGYGEPPTYMWEKRVFLNCVGAVRSTELEYGPNSFELIGINDGDDPTNTLVLQARDSSDRKEWIFQFHCSLAKFMRNLVDGFESRSSSYGAYLYTDLPALSRPASCRDYNHPPSSYNYNPYGIQNSYSDRHLHMGLGASPKPLTPFHHHQGGGGGGVAMSNPLSHGHGRITVHRRRRQPQQQHDLGGKGSKQSLLSATGGVGGVNAAMAGTAISGAGAGADSTSLSSSMSDMDTTTPSPQFYGSSYHHHHTNRGGGGFPSPANSIFRMSPIGAGSGVGATGGTNNNNNNNTSPERVVLLPPMNSMMMSLQQPRQPDNLLIHHHHHHPHGQPLAKNQKDEQASAEHPTTTSTSATASTTTTATMLATTAISSTTIPTFSTTTAGATITATTTTSASITTGAAVVSGGKKYIPPHLRSRQQEGEQKAPIKKKYIPPHLRGQADNANTNASKEGGDAAAIPKRYIPPHLRNNNNNNNVDGGDNDKDDDGNLATLNQSQSLLSLAQRADIAPSTSSFENINNNGMDDNDDKLHSLMIDEEDYLNVINQDPQPCKLGGCADPSIMKGSILDSIFIPRKSSKLGPIPNQAYGCYGGGGGSSSIEPSGDSLNETEGAASSASTSTTKTTTAATTTMSRLRWETGAFSECGIRDSNEDSYLIANDLLATFTSPLYEISELSSWIQDKNTAAVVDGATTDDSNDKSNNTRTTTIPAEDRYHKPGLFAVFDGHCGNQAARYAAEKLLYFIRDELLADIQQRRQHSSIDDDTTQGKASTATVTATATTTTNNNNNEESSPLHPSNIQGTIRAAIRKLDDKFCHLCQEEGREWESGATALIAMLVNEHLVIANLGDCRGVLCRSIAEEGGNEKGGGNEKENEEERIRSIHLADNLWNELLDITGNGDGIDDNNHDEDNNYKKNDNKSNCFWREITNIHSPGSKIERQRIEQANGWITTETEIPIGQLQRMDFLDEDVIGILKRYFQNDDKTETSTTATNSAANVENPTNNVGTSTSSSTFVSSSSTKSNTMTPARQCRAAPQRILEISRVCGELAVSRALGDRDFKAAFNATTPAAATNSTTTSSATVTTAATTLSGTTSSSAEETTATTTTTTSAGITTTAMWDCPLFLPYPDYHSRQFQGDLVSNEPDFQSIRIGQDGIIEEFVLLACDGLWDVLDADDAIRVTRDLLFRKHWTAKRAAARLAELAIHLGSSDNITVIVIRLLDSNEVIGKRKTMAKKD